MEKAGSHIAMDIMLGTFRRRLPEDSLAEPVDLHVEWSTSDTMPRGPPIGAHVHDVQDVADVLEQPTREGVLRWYPVA